MLIKNMSDPIDFSFREELDNVKKHMNKNNIPAPYYLKVDNEYHEYQISINGKRRTIKYAVFLDPMESHEGIRPFLVADYSIVEENKNYNYSSLK